MDAGSKDETDTIRRDADDLTRALIEALEALERLQRRFQPPLMEPLCGELRPFADALRRARERLGPTGGTEGTDGPLEQAAGLVSDALRLVLACADLGMEQGVMQLMRALRKACRAQETLFPLRRQVPALNRFFLEPPLHGRTPDLDPRAPAPPEAGPEHEGVAEDPYARGALSFYAPGSGAGAEPRPLVVALHGGFGHGRDFIWTWVREARSRRFFLLAPTSRGTTWSLMAPQIDGPPLAERVARLIAERNVDPERVLLTGVSDGGTFALVTALGEDGPFTAFAPVACALPPANLSRARGKEIRWVHGALDWMFPVHTAERAARILEGAGARIVFRRIEDLSHAYPREENARILSWFDRRLELA